MTDNVGEDFWYRGDDLMQPQQQLLFQKIQEAIHDEQGEVVYILSSLENNSQRYQILHKEQESLVVNEENSEKINNISNQLATIHTTQSELLLLLQPRFNELFDQIASDTQGGMGYNEVLRSYVWQDLIEVFRKEPGAMDGSRDQYRFNAHSHKKKKNSPKDISKTKKFRIPKDHRLLTEESYPQLQASMWTHIDNAVTAYQKKFLRDIENKDDNQRLIEHYFLFIFTQMLVQSQVVFDITKPKSNAFVQTVIDDVLVYIQQKYGITMNISSDLIKKKLFVTQDSEEEITTPLEFTYANSMEDDLLVWEKYLNTLFFANRQTSVDKIRGKIQKERNQSVDKMNMVWELMNPLYHIAKEKKSKILATLEILRKHQAENNLVADIIIQMETALQKTEEDIKKSVVFEEDPMLPSIPDSPTKLQQQELKRYQVSPQYWKMFGLVINRLNHYYQIKSNVSKRAKKSNDEAFDRLLCSEQNRKDIKNFIDSLITEHMLTQIFEQKWTNKLQEKQRKIEGLCRGTSNVHKLGDKKKKKNTQNTQGQMCLDF